MNRLAVWASFLLVGCGVGGEVRDPGVTEAAQTIERLAPLPAPQTKLKIPVFPLPPFFFCGQEGNACCHAPAASANPVYGPLVHCDNGLGCDVASDTCVQPCGGATQVCCDGPNTRALKWTDAGAVYSPTNFGMREMCDSGGCDKPTHRCFSCGTVAGTACCPPDAAQATARCFGANLFCDFQNDAATTGVCTECGVRGKAPCDWGCNSGLKLRKGLCDFCGAASQLPCDADVCKSGCDAGLRLAKGLCTTCGGNQQPPCDALNIPGPKCSLYQSACDPGLKMLKGLCQICGGEKSGPCDAGCDAPLKLQNGLCTRCGIEWSPQCDYGCDSGMSLAHKVCRHCGAEYQIPCDAGCKAPMKPAGGYCHYCGGATQAPCDVGGCNPGLTLRNGACVADDPTTPTCAAPTEACVPDKQPGTHCCQTSGAPQFCVYGHCKLCVPHGDECKAFGSQLCCDTSDSCVLDQSSEKTVCDIPDGPNK
jgi:hypothetical protein